MAAPTDSLLGGKQRKDEEVITPDVTASAVSARRGGALVMLTLASTAAVYASGGAAAVAETALSSRAAKTAALSSSCKPANADKYSVKFYKRTSFSLSPQSECGWIDRLFDDSASNFNFTVEKDGATETCASRCSWFPLGYAMHEVRSNRALEGPFTADDWIRSWVETHGVLGSESWLGWDEWMHNSLTFWTGSLDPFLLKFEEYDEPYLARSYVNPVDGVTTYVAYVVDHSTGGVIELHSTSIASMSTKGSDNDDPPPPGGGRRRLEEDSFREFRPEECGAANALAFNTTDMDEWLTASVSEQSGTTAANPILLVRVQVPTSDTSTLGTFANKMKLDQNVTELASADEDAACGYSSTPLAGESGFGSTNGSYILLQTVRNDAARKGKHTVRDYETYVKQLHGKLMGENAGWDKFIDSHIGLYLSGVDGGDTSLDELTPLLEKYDVPYMPHRETDVGAVTNHSGSIWTAGFGGLAVEFHGSFDYSCLKDVPKFEFCNPTR